MATRANAQRFQRSRELVCTIEPPRPRRVDRLEPICLSVLNHNSHFRLKQNAGREETRPACFSASQPQCGPAVPRILPVALVASSPQSSRVSFRTTHYESLMRRLFGTGHALETSRRERANNSLLHDWKFAQGNYQQVFSKSPSTSFGGRKDE